jgi:hypothetical protein
MSTKLGTILADFTTNLAASIQIGGSTATLQSATDDDGIALPAGRYFFTLDGENSNKEHFSCNLSGISLTNLNSISRQGIETPGAVRPHRIGCTVSLTDFAHIKYINDILNGTTDLDASNPLQYDGPVSITGSNQLATKGYVDSVAVAGAPNATTSQKGIVQAATLAQLLAKTATGSSGAILVTTPDIMPSTLLSDYVADTGTANTYVITPVPAITAYTAGQIFSFKAVNANTGPSTLAVNGLTAQSIKKLDGATALAAGDIAAGQFVHVGYDGTEFVMLNPSAKTILFSGSNYPAGNGSAITNVSAGQLSAIFTYGETLAAGQPVCVLPLSTVLPTFDAQDELAGSGTTISKTFTVANQSNRILIVALQTSNSSTYDVSGITYGGISMTKLKSLDGTGTFVGQRTQIWYLLAPATGANTLAITSTNSANSVTANIYSYYNAAQVAPPEADGIGGSGVASASITPTVNGSLVFGIASQASGIGGNVYVNNTSGSGNTTGDSGTKVPPVSCSLSMSGGGNVGVIICVLAPAVTSPSPRIYRAGSLVAGMSDSYIGIVQTSGTVTQTGSVIMNGIDANQSGLTIGAKYYLNDTVGTIGTSAGTVTRKVGIAISATQLLITNIW